MVSIAGMLILNLALLPEFPKLCEHCSYPMSQTIIPILFTFVMLVIMMSTI